MQVSIPYKRVTNIADMEEAINADIEFQSPISGSQTLGRLNPQAKMTEFQSPISGSQTLSPNRC